MLRSFLTAALLLVAIVAQAQAESTYVKFLKSGRVPPERMGAVLGLIAKNGEADDLAYVLEQATKKDGFPAEAKPAALEALLEAATTRNLKPSGELSALKELLADKDAKPAARLATLKLIGLWKVEAAAGDIETILAEKATPADQRKLALTTLAQIGGPRAVATFTKLSSKENSLDARILAVAGLANIDAAKAAPIAASVLADLSGEADLAPLIDAFLAQKTGAADLAAALAKAKLSPDAAKLALRHMYSIGRADESLVAAFSAAAGIATEVKPPSPEELKKLVAAVNAQGDAQRGEQLFRRVDLSCQKCHALSGAGGNIGPELSAVGQTSPVDYVITSILAPELAVKEEFQLAKVITSEGKVHVGIIAEDNPDRLVLKDGDGKRITIPKDGEEEIVRGGSLMPKGLSNFLTQGEFLDLVKFVSELGKPNGAYPIRKEPTVQRWRVLSPTPDKPSREVPNEQVFRDDILGSPNWQPAYAKVAGALPLTELHKPAGSPTLFLQSEISVTTAGGAIVDFGGEAEGITAWLGEKPLVVLNGEVAVDLEAGTHKLTLRVDCAQRKDKELRVVIRPATENAAEYTVVGGP